MRRIPHTPPAFGLFSHYLCYSVCLVHSFYCYYCFSLFDRSSFSLRLICPFRRHSLHLFLSPLFPLSRPPSFPLFLYYSLSSLFFSCSSLSTLSSLLEFSRMRLRVLHQCLSTHLRVLMDACVSLTLISSLSALVPLAHRLLGVADRAARGRPRHTPREQRTRPAQTAGESA